MGSRKSKHKNNSKQPKSQPANSATSVQLPAVLEPKPWPVSDELPEDAAVFNGQALATLSEVMRSECEAVKHALELVENGQDGAAATALQIIPRQSPYSEWRLFIRGLSDFYRQAYDEACQSWSRLTASRRPARIACVLLQAAGQSRPDALANVVASAEALPVARQTLDRTSVVAEARKIAIARHRDRGILFSMTQASMLRSFADQFRRIDKQFATQFMQACVYACTQQGDRDVFQLVRQFVPGPEHDPHWQLIDLVRSMGSANDASSIFADLTKYFEKDLSNCKRLNESAKSALKSLVLTKLAFSIDVSHEYGDPDDFELKFKILAVALAHYSKNRVAHEARIEMVEDQLDDDDLGNKAKQNLQLDHMQAMEQLADAFPEDGVAALRLANIYLDNQRFDLAEQQAQKATALRVDSPQAKTLPWKAKLLQAVHACRSKAKVLLAKSMLEEAIAMWPIWLSRDWIGFLRAAFELRLGDTEAFARLQSQAIAEGKIPPLTAALMTHLANQMLSVPAKQLKSYREDLDRRLELTASTDKLDLLWCGSFLWDLERMGLAYEGMSRREAHMAEAIAARTAKIDFAADHAQASYCWLANNDFFNRSSSFISKATTARSAAALIDFLLLGSHNTSDTQIAKLLEIVENGLATESDAWYRDDMRQTVDNAKYYLASDHSEDNFSDFARFAKAFAARMGIDLSDEELGRQIFHSIDDEDDEDDEDDDEDDEEDDDFEDDLNDADGSDGDLSDLFSRFHQAQAPEIHIPPPKTPAERKAFNKQRQKELDRKKNK